MAIFSSCIIPVAKRYKKPLVQLYTHLASIERSINVEIIEKVFRKTPSLIDRLQHSTDIILGSYGASEHVVPSTLKGRFIYWNNYKLHFFEHKKGGDEELQGVVLVIDKLTKRSLPLTSMRIKICMVKALQNDLPLVVFLDKLAPQEVCIQGFQWFHDMVSDFLSTLGASEYQIQQWRIVNAPNDRDDFQIMIYLIETIVDHFTSPTCFELRDVGDGLRDEAVRRYLVCKFVDESTKVGVFDWRTIAGTTPIKQQGGGRTCWAFATAAAVEYMHWLKTGKLISLSVQQLVDCVKESKYVGRAYCWTTLHYISQYGLQSALRYPPYTGRVRY